VKHRGGTLKERGNIEEKGGKLKEDC
jgi:hypothetical protein